MMRNTNKLHNADGQQ